MAAESMLSKRSAFRIAVVLFFLFKLFFHFLFILQFIFFINIIPMLTVPYKNTDAPNMGLIKLAFQRVIEFWV